MLVISGVILMLSTGFALRARPKGVLFDGRVFWLGAAFMLVEVHNVSRLALVFGTTWQVNAWVIAAILSLILVANAVCTALQRRGRRSGKWAVIGLFATLTVAFLLPVGRLVAYGPLVGGSVAVLALTAPIFFAGLVFADAFARSPAPSFALGWNVLGAVLGGLAENVSYLFGIPALIPLAALFYALAVGWPQRVAADSTELASD